MVADIDVSTALGVWNFANLVAGRARLTVGSPWILTMAGI